MPRLLVPALALIALLSLACQTAPNPPQTPLPPTTALPAAPPPSVPAERSAPPTPLSPTTPLPASVLPTPPTPISLAAFRTAALSQGGLLPIDFSAGHVVALAPMAGEVSVIDVETGESQPLGGGRVRAWTVAISEKYAAWIEDVADSSEVFLMERETGEIVQVTQVPAERRNLKIDGNRLVWEDRRNESDEHYTHFDIYAYDIELGQEIPVAVAPGAQKSPAMRGDKAIWLDARNSPALGDYLNDCQRCPENTFDLYLYDFSTGKERVIIQDAHERAHPDIYGNRIVRADEDADGNPAIILHDLDTGLDETLASIPRVGIYPPSVSDRHVVWTVARDCDVVIIPTPDTNTGVFAYDLETRSVAQLTNYVEPQAMLDGSVVVIHEGCHMAGRIYAVFLEE